MVFKNICNSLIVFLLIFNQLGLSHNMHFCGGKLFSISFYNNITKCGMHKIKLDDTNNSLDLSTQDCCKDTQLNYNTNDFKNQSTFELNYPKKTINKFICGNPINYKYAHRKISSYSDPPILIQKFYINSLQLLFYG